MHSIDHPSAIEQLFTSKSKMSIRTAENYSHMNI
jgi:hypothetical protein